MIKGKEFIIPEGRETLIEKKDSDQSKVRLSKEDRQTWQYLKGQRNFQEKLLMDMNFLPEQSENIIY